MRQPDQVTSVLFDLSRSPHVVMSLFQGASQRLESYLRNQAWPENLDEVDAAAPDSEEASEQAEMASAVETFLETLSPAQVGTLERAMEAVYPGAREAMQALMPMHKAENELAVLA